jgi:hypothetical protein
MVVRAGKLVPRFATEAETRTHRIVVGASGSGKSMCLMAEIAWLLRNTKDKVCWLDCAKGEGVDLAIKTTTALAEMGVHLAPDDVGVVRPFRDQLVPLNLARLDHAVVAPDIIPSLLTQQIKALVGDASFGPRMELAAAHVGEIVIGLGCGGASTMLRLLTDADYAEQASWKLEDEELRSKCARLHTAHPKASLAAIAARIALALRTRSVRAMLDADSCISPADLIAKRVTVIDLSGPPFGAHAVGESLARTLMDLVLLACLGRRSQSSRLHLLVDEAQAAVNGEGLGVLLSQVRWKKVTVTLASQSAPLLEAAGIGPSLDANITRAVYLNPDVHALAMLKKAGALPEPTGRRRHPSEPRLLSKVEEASANERRVLELGVRQGIYVNYAAGGASRTEIIARTIDFPIEKVETLVQRSAQAESFARGTLAMSVENLEARRSDPTFDGENSRDEVSNEEAAAAEAAPKKRRKRKRGPVLILPTGEEA